MQTISVAQLAQRQQQGNVDLLDVRTAVEFREVHAVGARNVPLNRLDPAKVMQTRSETADQPLYLICKSGSRSAMAYHKFTEAGFNDVCSVDGGTGAWDEAGLPVSRGKKAMSLERQVRILAGFLALLGAVLGFFVHPYFIGLSAFIGAGLMFAGVTDTCGMGMMLARMPWNQVSVQR